MIAINEDTMNTQDKIQREILPVPDIPQVGLTTYDAKDPDTKYPPIEPLRPPEGAPLGCHPSCECRSLRRARALAAFAPIASRTS